MKICLLVMIRRIEALSWLYDDVHEMWFIESVSKLSDQILPGYYMKRREERVLCKRKFGYALSEGFSEGT